MKNIMTLLKEQKEAKKCSKKKDKGYRRILYPKTKADLIAGKNMNRIIGKAINNYQEFTRSAVLRGILKPSVSSVDRDEELQDIDTVDTAQDSSITEFVSTTEHSTTKELENIEFIDANKDSVMTELTNVAQESENIDTIDTTEHIPNHSNSQDELPVCKHKYWETLALLTNLGQEKFNVTSGLLTLKYTNKSKIKLKELLITSQNSRNKPNKLFAINFIKLPVSKPNVSSELSEFNKVVGVTGCENLNTVEGNSISESCDLNKSFPVVDRTHLSSTDRHLISRLRNLNSFPVVEYANLNNASPDQTVKLQNLNKSPPVVTFIKRPVSKPQKFNKSFPVVDRTHLSSTDRHLISRLRNLNSFPVVEYANFNTIEENGVLKLQNLNNPPVVKFAISNTVSRLQNFNKFPVVDCGYSNTAGSDGILKSRKFNKSPVVSFIKWNTKDPNTIQKLQNLNNLPIANYATSNTTNPHQSLKLQNLNKPPPVVECPNLNSVDSYQRIKLKNFNNSPVVHHAILNTADPNPVPIPRNLSKSLPVVEYAILNTTKANSILRSLGLNKFSPVVSFIKQPISKPQKFNKSPVVNDATSNTPEPYPIQKLQTLNDPTVVDSGHLSSTDPNKILRLRKFNKSPVVNYLNLTTTKLDPIQKLQILNKSPSLVNPTRLSTVKANSIKKSPTPNNFPRPQLNHSPPTN